MKPLQIDANFLVYILVLVATITGAVYVVRDRLDSLIKTVKEHRDEDKLIHATQDAKIVGVEAACELADEKERTTREAAIQSARDLAHGYAMETQKVVASIAAENQKTIAELKLSNQEGRSLLQIEIATLRGRLEEKGRPGGAAF